MSKRETVLKELKNCSRISNIRMLLEHFISPRNLHKIINSLQDEGYIIAHIHHRNKEYCLIQDKNGVFYN